MSKKTIITVLGLIVIVLPFLGMPDSITTPVFVILGVGVIFVARVGSKKKILKSTHSE